MTRPTPIATARRIFEERYPKAKVVLLAGSVIRGEGTAHSDLDLVVIYDELKSAYRESFLFDGWPVEAFVHDPATLAYFTQQVDIPTGVPSLCHMVADGIAIGEESDLCLTLKRRAKALLDRGPDPLTDKEIDGLRYAISDQLDDLRAPRDHAEAVASATVLYGTLTNFWFRSQRRWSAKGKSIPRRVRALDPAFADRLEAAFLTLFSDGEPADVIRLAEELLAPYGGCLFEGYTSVAPQDWRKQPGE